MVALSHFSRKRASSASLIILRALTRAWRLSSLSSTIQGAKGVDVRRNMSSIAALYWGYLSRFRQSSSVIFHCFAGSCSRSRSLGQKFRGIDRKLAVCSQAQPVFCFPETDKEAAGEAAAAQIMLHAFSVVLSCNMVGKCLFHGNDCTMDKRELTSQSFHGIIEKRNGS